MPPDIAHIYAMAANSDEPLDPPDPEKFATDRTTVTRAFWSKVRKTVGRVPFLEDAIAAYFCATDSTTPTAVKALLFGALAYFIVPIDMIPDFIAGLGFVDDASILSAAVAMARRHIRPEHRDRAKTLLDQTLRAASDD
jgi:uncharacterized membrane protein YkvA (DUF1232 family)